MVNQRFSDRIGATIVPSVLQIESMSNELRNNLWNLLIMNIFVFEESHTSKYKLIMKYLCVNLIKDTIDTIPNYDGDRLRWLRGIFFDKKTPWWQIYNIIEFMANNCGRLIPWADPKKFCDRTNIFLENEMSGYRFIDGVLAPITNQHEIDAIHEAMAKAQSKGLNGTRQHLATAVDLMSKRPDPDYRNSIKESISAVESVCKQITGEAGGGLDKAMSKLDLAVGFHGAFKAGILSLYGYTSDESGIRHAILDEPNLGLDEAKFMLVSCSALVNFIIMKAEKAGLIPLD